MITVFIDGQEGTTGLQIHQRLRDQPDLTLLEIDPQRRKDPSARAALLNQADVVITCLPDAAAKEAVAMVTNDRTRIVDPSVAHRTAQGWVYGMPELEPGQRERIRRSRRVSVPGCHATGFVSIMRPLTLRGLVPADYPVVAIRLPDTAAEVVGPFLATRGFRTSGVDRVPDVQVLVPKNVGRRKTWK